MTKDTSNKNVKSEKATKSKASKKLIDSKTAPQKESTSKKSSKAKTKTSPKVSSKAIETTRSKKASTRKKTSSTKISSKQTKSAAKTMLSEYYDLPYRYNQTIVKILAQTPTTLFVYWDISDKDRGTLINEHGRNFFTDTRPILIVHNITRNYSFEIEINDFANSWYIRTQEPNCDYVIELGRKYNNVNNEYIYINSSNNIVSPNDHILFENANLNNVLFKNVKTNKVYGKDFGNLTLISNLDKIYGNIYDVYSALYNDEILTELANPSSNEFYRKSI